jgi:phytoene dehydrogenase-like protein
VSGIIHSLREPIDAQNEKIGLLHVRVSHHDPTLAPKGRAVVTAWIPGNYDYWANLRARRADYEAEKQAFAKQVIARLDARFPGLADHVEMMDVSTPATFARYTLNRHGSIMGFMATPANWQTRIAKTLPGLEHFSMAGQWSVNGGGLPPAGFTGRHVIQLLCKRDSKRFMAFTPRDDHALK